MRVTWTDYDLRAPAPASPAEVELVEATLGVRLPLDFLAVAGLNQGRSPTPCVFTLGDGTEGVFNHLLHFERSSPSSSIIGVWDGLRDILPARLVPFAADPGGNVLCFDYRESSEQPRVVFWLHDDPNAPTQRVADSFTHLLELLHD